ncbi:hypothetical protein Q73A0000_06910 [Kaistella flava (ex Peng et al. 2021)]|uniref:Uncharacterized protein n=1 Tax=Kaistella flava (ex Peng et al. 2021) TaxID=2038776 RepID=A0A7M2Y7M5_9FLAO|nr:hypothetical protein [Kaistella flava (ex Peng et al. 2021)]QOW09832.1 hypothetical protein Q73A0000_05365 [Kaistella flava (ex Peng et al. 2021)]QOW10106.1 hypothetical protein Q73A0000_06910 [Kaistella flava (ex Peng et al. 2021)]
MTQFIIILLALYALYYVGNIVYDLFLKKESAVNSEENEDFYHLDFEELNKTEVTTVGIEDVENLNTPKSFSQREFPIETTLLEERQNMDHWRERFESEQNIDSFNAKKLIEPTEEKIIEDSELKFEEKLDSVIIDDERIQNQQNDEVNLAIKKLNSDRWKKMLNLAETNVQLIKNIDGFKVYQSSAM